jgi:hypothetical protein
MVGPFPLVLDLHSNGGRSQRCLQQDIKRLLLNCFDLIFLECREER